jgi:hypothetical protein
VKRLAALVLALVTVVVVALLAGCGGGSKSAVTQTQAATTPAAQSTPTRRELAHTYLSIIRPTYDARDHFIEQASRWNDKTTGDDIAKDAAPMIATVREADDKLLRVNWPPEIAVDVKELVRAEEAAARDLGATANVRADARSITDWYKQYKLDGAKVAAATNVVRADLGLPPLTN